MKRIAVASLAFVLAGAGCGTNLTPAGGPDAAPLACLPNLDNQIVAAELPVVLGVADNYYVSPAGATRQVDLDPDSSGAWDFTQPASDPTVAITATSINGKWYAGSFPDGQFVVPYDTADTLEAVYAEDDVSFRLYGIASTEQAPAGGQTLLPYDAPVALYRFPITGGQSWTEIGVVSHGTLDGLPYVGRDTYDIEVDPPARLVLPDVEFTQTFLVRTKITVAPSVGVTAIHRQASFLFECFGEVARATAVIDDPDDDFTTAAEVRRFTF